MMPNCIPVTRRTGAELYEYLSPIVLQASCTLSEGPPQAAIQRAFNPSKLHCLSEAPPNAALEEKEHQLSSLLHLQRRDTKHQVLFLYFPEVAKS
jgi:hypothetical protein